MILTENGMGAAFDPDAPLESMARAYLSIFINRDDAYKERYIARLVAEFGIDGVGYHAARTCPNNTNSHYNLPRRLQAAGVPGIVMDGDLNDLRCFSDEQSTTLLEAFMAPSGSSPKLHTHVTQIIPAGA